MNRVIKLIYLFFIYGAFVLYASAAVEPNSLVFSRNLAIPERGTDVSTLQQFLITNGYLSILEPTGYFGKQTFAAVAKWQGDVGLSQTGFFGPMSRAKIQKSFDISRRSNSVSDSNDSISNPILDLVVASDLQMGDVGNEVSSLQTFLITKGLLFVDKPTGYFGPLTVVALQKWQANSGIPATGYFGPLTRESLKRLRLPNNENSPIPAPTLSTANLNQVNSPSPGSGESNGEGPSQPINTTPLPMSQPVVAPVAPPILPSVSTTTTATTTPLDALSPLVSIINPTSSSVIKNTVSSNFGIAGGSSLLGLDTEKMNKAFDDLVSLGVGWVRIDMEWRHIQWKDDPLFFDWSKFDRFVDLALTHNIKILTILDFAPKWAEDPACPGDTPHCAPASPALFATFAKAVVERYSSKGISHWEIWNEPNSYSFWGPKSDCVAYTDLLKATYPIIKKADPEAVVITAGLSPASTDGTNMAPMDFLTCVYENGGKNYFDAVGSHPYTFPTFPSVLVPHAWAQMSVTSPNLRSIMIENGDSNKKIWMTEFGVPTNGPDSNWYVSEDKQAQMMIDAVNLYKTYDWVGPIFWYTLKDSGADTTTNENFFGLIRFDGSLKPAYKVLKDLISNGI